MSTVVWERAPHESPRYTAEVLNENFYWEPVESFENKNSAIQYLERHHKYDTVRVVDNEGDE